MITDPAFYWAAVPAVVFLGLAKGGLSGIGILALPLMALVISPVQAAAITLPILIVQDVVSVFAFRHTIAWGLLRRLLPACVVGILIGTALAAYVSDGAVKLAVGAVSVAFAGRRLVLDHWGKPDPEPAKPGPAADWFWGTAIGFTSMIAHAGGPPFQIHVMPMRLPRDVFVGTGAILFALVNWIKVPPYWSLGQFTPGNLKTSAVLFPLAIASTGAGVWLVRRTPVERFYTLIYVLLALVGAKLVWDGLAALA
jgi:uncharacterized membrane protein YfcA